MSFKYYIQRRQRELLGLAAILVIGIVGSLVFRAMTADPEPEATDPAPVVESTD